MKLFYLFLIIFGFTSKSQAQNSKSSQPSKPPIDTSLFRNWTYIGAPSVTNNGQFFLYSTSNQSGSTIKLILKSKNDSWERQFTGVSNAVFSTDSRKALFINSGDSLCIYTLGGDGVEYMSNIKNFRLLTLQKVQWVACELKAPEKCLLLRDLTSEDILKFSNISRYFLVGGRLITIKSSHKGEDSVVDSLCIMRSPGNEQTLLWEGKGISNLIYSWNERLIAFIGKSDKNYRPTSSIWNIDLQTGVVKEVPIDNTDKIENKFTIVGLRALSYDGTRLFITLKDTTDFGVVKDPIMVDVWNYKDPKLQSLQFNELKVKGKAETIDAVVDLENGKITTLNGKNEEIRLYLNKKNDNLAIITKTGGGDISEYNWNQESVPSFYLVDTRTGIRKRVPLNYPSVSPNGKFLVGSNSSIPYLVNNLLSYNIETGKVCNLTKSFSTPMNESEVFGSLLLKHRNIQILRWFENGNKVLVKDKYDLWCLDITGKSKPFNVTNEFGRKNQISFNLSDDYYNEFLGEDDGEIIISGFNEKNKMNGFYKVSLTKLQNPVLLTDGPYVYCASQYNMGKRVIKSKDSNVYVVRRESATESPNYFWTFDFKHFVPITEIHPERQYNWMKAKLVFFTTLAGRKETGILYTPENFDPQKKYPVIIHYYEKMSNRLNQFLIPDATYAHINIPWFVSNGYIVFTPDIHFVAGKTGENAYNSVVGAAKYLTKFPWVDAKHLGIQGHSFGGYETNYIVTHTNIFAAAMSSSGMSDDISDYLSITEDGYNKMSFYEINQNRIGATLWENPDLYIKSSPIFYADKIETPLLMMNNKKDGIVNFEQGTELFTALRRLGKRVWMLQYDNGVHTLYPYPWGGRESIQHTIRITQFFDHYLKGTAPPKWMTRGIPAKLKGIDDGLELDNEIKTPGKGLLMNP
ncbi:peptidase S9 prolyl oligopeptidase active site domain-containing protein [Niastella koreensis GR20-10]|uniref:Peptidase S9 prolyl oligopeptidase active site domain-containing protein n=2 Tax=Niastella koreensis TaxID=354356 RepID=G8TLY0_NIAKG|nr:prolyl oligopeptidase family serine peptidase [Niastella koreensis]AEV98740.1 peptidase S9 prolyl oligopeptidase active site domain-containing protein [Niastella koreensis GR20-10]